MGKPVANHELNTVDASKAITRSAECLRRLMEAGLSYKDLQLPIDDPEMRDRLVRFWKLGGRETAHIFVDYTKPLSCLIDDGAFDCVYPDITEETFPIKRRLNGQVEMKVFSIKDLVGETRFVTSKEVIKAMNEKGYREAELPEGLAYAKTYPDEQRKYPIVILGSVWRHFGGHRVVPRLIGWHGNRGLYLPLYDSWRNSDNRFLAVRK